MVPLQGTWLPNYVFPLLTSHAVYAYVSFQQPKHHILPTLLELDPSPLRLPVQRALYRHPSTVRRLQLGTVAYHM